MGRVWRRLGLLVSTLALVAGCTSSVDGRGQVGLHIAGFSASAFDVQVEQSLQDVFAFWTATYPTIDPGHALHPLKGDLYSVDGDAIAQTGTRPPSAKSNACLAKKLRFIIDNAAYCQLDDSIIWDRSPDHLLPVLSAEYGPAITELVFAHEFGHAVQQRLGLTKLALPTIDIESQADCAAGAFAAYALAGHAKHLHLTAASLDMALVGFLQVRDSTPDSPQDISHGNGFDRLTALQQGIRFGATYCFSPSYFDNRTFTERGYVTDHDRSSGGNQPLAQLLEPDDVVADLNRFWAAAGTQSGHPFTSVHLVEAAHPKCGASAASQFGYCPDDNTVYYSKAFARRAYYSITVPAADHSGAVTLRHHEPGDYALGSLFAVAWGMAARHQFADASTTNASALIAAVCYAGAYSEDINRPVGDSTLTFILSPPDLDEATSAVLGLVGRPAAFGARGTTGLRRVQAFVAGYSGGLAAC